MSFFNKIFRGNKKNEIKFSLDWLGGDMHNHILPGIDDGSQSVEQSLKLIKNLNKLGIRKMVCTPHVMAEVHENTPKTIQASFDKLTKAVNEQGLEVEIKFSAEYMIDSQLDNWISSDNLCPLPKNYMLIEMSYLSESKALFQTILDVQNKGFQPVLAHPERYNYYHDDFKMYKKIKDAGCMLQMNALSISRYYGVHVKTACLMLLKSGMYDFLGTDLHHDRHAEALELVLGKYDLREILNNNPIKNQMLFDSSPAVDFNGNNSLKGIKSDFAS